MFIFRELGIRESDVGGYVLKELWPGEGYVGELCQTKLMSRQAFTSSKSKGVKT